MLAWGFRTRRFWPHIELDAAHHSPAADPVALVLFWRLLGPHLEVKSVPLQQFSSISFQMTKDEVVVSLLSAEGEPTAATGITRINNGTIISIATPTAIFCGEGKSLSQS
eukprot:GABV01010531.1.p1 GENE.GABV01010531.1~~GABV01010531.1.p1  ORF type:complete len:128 (+),score=29.77 GABV01010531.1:57-386(+)